MGTAARAEPGTQPAGLLSVAWEAETGRVSAIRYRDELLTATADASPTFDLRDDAGWLIGPRRVKARRLKESHPDPQTTLIGVEAGSWEVLLRYQVDPRQATLAQSATVTWHGASPTKLKGFWFGLPPLALGKESSFFFPGAYPPKRYAGDALRPDDRRGAWESPASLIVQLAPARSMIFLSDELAAAADRASVSAQQREGGLQVSQAFAVQSRMNPGQSQEIGTAWLTIAEADGEAALRRIPQWMQAHGHVTPADRPAWFRDAVIYSFHPGGTIGAQFKDLGGFHAAGPLVDDVAALGATAVWIMPIEDAAVYHPRDYYKFQDGLGTAEEYRDLVARAHRLGLHVLQDIVPHGGRNDYPRAKEHPEWLVFDEDGSTLSYWCYDFNWPTWREYMAGVASHYVRQFGVDGYRVDAVGGSRIPNWNPQIPYARASFAQLQGGLNMLRSLRGAVKEAKPDGGILAEVQGSVYGAASDAVYDFTGCYTVQHDLRKLPPDQFVDRLRRWLHEQQYTEVPDLLRLRHVESHDSLRGQLWYGVEPMRAMMALTAWIHGVPLVYHEMESGHSRTFRRIFAIRRVLPELCGGDADYLSVQTPPGVFACLRTAGEGASVVLVNFCGTPLDGEARVPLNAVNPFLGVA
jgi:hypothetical protein